MYQHIINMSYYLTSSDMIKGFYAKLKVSESQEKTARIIVQTGRWVVRGKRERVQTEKDGKIEGANDWAEKIKRTREKNGDLW